MFPQFFSDQGNPKIRQTKSENKSSDFFGVSANQNNHPAEAKDFFVEGVTGEP